MSLLGIDIGTTGCKAAAFTSEGIQLAISYRDYDIIGKNEGHEELDSDEIWEKVQQVVREVALSTENEDPVQALSVSSLGEALVPVTKDRNILGNSILGSDQRGNEFLEQIKRYHSEHEIYGITGNLPGTYCSMVKVVWLKNHHPDIYNDVDYFMTWADFICFMLGGKPVTTYSLAGRTLLFDIKKCNWSEGIFRAIGLDELKFATPNPSGVLLGYINNEIAGRLNLNKNVSIISGGHDQCCAILGSGLKNNPKTAMYGLGTYICVAPVFHKLPQMDSAYKYKLPIEHHVVPGFFASLIYNQSGGALIKWFKQTFFSGTNSSVDKQYSYAKMFDELTELPNKILVLPLFGASGPPDFLPGNLGFISGLSLNDNRGDILYAILEGICFYVRDSLERMKDLFHLDSFIATGGGAVSDKWLQVTADILNKKIVRNKVTEAGSLGAAILAGIGSEIFPSFDRAIDSMVHQEQIFAPNELKKHYYSDKFNQYKKTFNYIIQDYKTPSK
jgi:xylulokinase